MVELFGRLLDAAEKHRFMYVLRRRHRVQHTHAAIIIHLRLELDVVLRPNKRHVGQVSRVLLRRTGQAACTHRQPDALWPVVFPLLLGVEFRREDVVQGVAFADEERIFAHLVACVLLRRQ